MKLLSLLFTNLLAFFMLTRVRRVVALTLAGALAFTAVAPPAKAQLGIPAIIAAVDRSSERCRQFPTVYRRYSRCDVPCGSRAGC